MHKITSTICICLAIALAGCESDRRQSAARAFQALDGAGLGTVLAMSPAAFEKRNELTKGAMERTPSPSQFADGEIVKAFYSNRTLLTFSPQHGTQIEYYTPDGRNYLWYPGNARILPGSWSVTTRDVKVMYEDPDIGDHITQQPVTALCFVYGANTYNPVTGNTGAKPECSLYSSTKRTLRESRSGDVFKLAQGGPAPLALTRDEATIDSLLKRMKTGTH